MRHCDLRKSPGRCNLQRSVAPFSQHYLAWSHEFMIATVPQADPLPDGILSGPFPSDGYQSVEVVMS